MVVNSTKLICYIIFRLVVLLPHIESTSIDSRTEMAILTEKNIIAVLDNTVISK